MAGLTFFTLLLLLIFLTTSPILPAQAARRIKRKRTLPFVYNSDYGRCIVFKTVPQSSGVSARGLPVYDGIFIKFNAGEGPLYNTFKAGERLEEVRATFIIAPKTRTRRILKPISVASWALGLTISEVDVFDSSESMNMAIYSSVPTGDYQKLNQRLPRGIEKNFTTLSYGAYKFNEMAEHPPIHCEQRLGPFVKEAKKIPTDCPPKILRRGTYALPEMKKNLNYKATTNTTVAYAMAMTGFDLPELRVAARVCFKGAR